MGRFSSQSESEGITVGAAVCAAIGAVIGVMVASALIVPGFVWVASNYIATSPALQGFAFRDLVAVGIGLGALASYFRRG